MSSKAGSSDRASTREYASNNPLLNVAETLCFAAIVALALKLDQTS
ncbi:MAG: hypothetical protein RBJ76_00490 [Stenomitos frigidus ULC029]